MSDPQGYNGSTIVDYETFMGRRNAKKVIEHKWIYYPCGSSGFWACPTCKAIAHHDGQKNVPCKEVR